MRSDRISMCRMRPLANSADMRDQRHRRRTATGRCRACALRLIRAPLVQPHHAVHLRGEPLVVRGDQRGAAFVATRPRNSAKTMSAVASSRLPVGSSASTSAGRLASARATATRCCSPPESWLGRWVEPLAEPERAEQRSRPARARLAAVGAADELRQHDILDRVEIGQQMVELVDEAERVAAHAVRPSSSSVGRLLAGDLDRAAEAALEQADRLQHGRFARARGPEQRDDLARRTIADRRRAARRSSTPPCSKLRVRPVTLEHAHS